MTIIEAIERVANRQSLRESEARDVMNSIMEGEATPAQIAGFLVALRMKGESGSEITGFARVMREKVVPVRTKHKNLVDTCGTGGDKVKTFNLSTAAAIIASAAGAPVAKHGNRAVTSKCGSADVLEALGVNLTLSSEAAGKLLDDIGLAFLFAPNHHPAMKHAAGPRKEMKLRTVFNLLGPLTNPAGADRQLIGVFAPNLTLKVAQVLRRLGCKRAVVAHGMVGLDEVSPIGTTKVAIVDNNAVTESHLNPEDFGIEATHLSEISAGESVETNAEMLKTAIAEPESPQCRAVLPGAGVALWLAEVVSDFREGSQIAREAVASGKAADKLKELVSKSNAR
ncbi:MAG: anthranilate phosphoribosyltransferase [Fimbriimonadales bacterium]|nr:anthranilate phosphoribosyltransferase [Fimbriimonadales bacterium]